MKTIKVTCAIILVNHQVLVVQRNKNMSLPLKWEFPGGKIEEGETEEFCLKREIKEELNIEIELVERLTPSIHRYPNITVELIPYVALQKRGQIKLNEHANFKFLDKEELLNLDWAEADVPIVKEYLAL
jgi:8-oxo-dGTP diphosphatase